MQLPQTPIPQNQMPPAPGPAKLDDSAIYSILQQFPFCYDRNKNVYGQATIRGRRKWVLIGSQEFLGFVQKDISTNYRQIVSPARIKNLLPMLTMHALETGRLVELHNRVARLDEAIYLETLNDAGDVVRVRPDGWDIIQDPPVIFKNYAHQASLPMPTHGGDIREFFEIFSIHSPDEQVLLATWLVMSLFTNLPRPHLWLVGEQGFGKTTLALSLKRLIDPSDRMSFLYNNSSEMGQLVDHHAIPAFDNITKFSSEISDFLCCTYSGVDFNKRRQYTNDEDFTFNIKKPVILTSISLGKVPSDLLDRCIVIEKSKFAFKTTSDEALMSRFDQSRPGILGAILTAASQTLRTYQGVQASNLVRTADYHRLGIAAAEAFGFGRECFETALRNNRHVVGHLQVKDVPSVALLIDFMNNRRSWRGYMSDLLQALKGLAPDPLMLPANASQLSRELNLAKATLEINGLNLQALPNDSGGRPYLIEHVFKPAEASSEASAGEPAGDNYILDMD